MRSLLTFINRRSVSPLRFAALFLACAVSLPLSAAASACGKSHLSVSSDAIDEAAFVKEIQDLSGEARDRSIVDAVLSGNVPAHLQRLVPVTMSGQVHGEDVTVTLCVTPDYLAVGSTDEFLRVPMGLPAAAEIASREGFLLPTPAMVDAIHAQAGATIAPHPLPPTNAMTTTGYFLDHNIAIARELRDRGIKSSALVSGIKKDLVLTNRLRRQPGRVAIYGWHQTSGRAIQPLSLVHGASYADYSHGVRLVSQLALVNGRSVRLSRIMADKDLASIVTGSEGVIPDAEGLQSSLWK